MCLLQYLNSVALTRELGPEFTVEFRLACSGELYVASPRPNDWRGYETSRVLLDAPFELYVTSRPFNYFPQELCLRLGLRYEGSANRQGGSTRSSPPFDEIVEDICALLTLVLRRPIVAVSQVNLWSSPTSSLTPSGTFAWNHPYPLLFRQGLKPSSVDYRRTTNSSDGGGIVEHTPSPVELNPRCLHSALTALPAMKHAQVVLRSARAYSDSLLLIDRHPQLAYQLLISAVEALSAVVYSKYRPTEGMVASRQGRLLKQAGSFGIDDGKAMELAKAACSGESWISAKFVKFLTQYSTHDAWGPDDLFPIADGYEPAEHQLEGALKAIYSARSKYLHEGASFPRGIARGETIAIPAKYRARGTAGREVPPVTWFERLVQVSIRQLIVSLCPEWAEVASTPTRRSESDC